MTVLKSPSIYSWNPRPWQQAVLDAQKKTTAIRCGRRLGKTDLCAYVAGSAFLTSTEPINIAVASFALNNAKRVIWNRIIELLSPFPSYVTYRKADNQLINNQTGSAIWLFGLSAEHGDSIRGHSFDLAVVDEYSLIPYEVFNSAFLPTLMDRDGWLLAISTPRGSFDLMTMLEAECDDPTNADTHVRFHFPASQVLGQVPNLTQEFLDKQKRRNPLTFALEYEADISASSSNTIFDTLLLAQAVTTETPILDPSLAVSAGLDFAPRRDKCILTLRNSINFVAIIQLEYNQDPYDFIQQLKNIISRYHIRTLAVDRGGAGEVISDMIENQLSSYWPIEDVRGVISGQKAYHSSNFNLRAELYAMLQDFLSHNESTISIHLPYYQQLCNELSATTAKPNEKGTFQVTSKNEIIERIGHSPDYADSAALSLYFERYTQSWQKPLDELTNNDISSMSNAAILDTFAGYYE